MNQSKFKVVKQEMARVNINILGISELKWTGMGELNSGDHNIYYHGQESLRRNRVAIIVNKTFQNAVLGCNLKNDRMICLFPRQTVTRVYVPRFFVSSQQRFGVTDIKALGVSQLLGLGQTVLQLHFI